ncbi:MAG: Holliday junction resolvase RuvX [Alphaproteobacteria bacterium]|nr:Holliday junction resolvase RuvX [Alphaproteobacteria bacterium]
MPVVDLENLPALLESGQRLMGLDVGSKTVGIAVSDSDFRIATPVEILRRTKFRADAERLFETVVDRNVGGLVIGLPVNMNGSEGPRCQSVRQFVANLIERRDMPATFWDERLSTVAVTRTMLDADISRKRRGKVVDKLAAAYILQGALDSLNLRQNR